MIKILAWHFTSDRLRDGRPIPAPGVTLRHKGPIELCASGFHASRHPLDALQYAPGPNLHRVECSVDIQEESDKLVARERTIVASSDITGLLDHFARQRALSVAHLWKPPEVVLDFLKTGDPNLREAAWAAARAAAGSAAWAAAGNAAWAAARAAAWDAAGNAAWDAARAAAWDAAGNAAWDAARAAAWDAAWDAAWAAARAAAWDAAWAAARDAAWDAARSSFEQLVQEHFAALGAP